MTKTMLTGWFIGIKNHKYLLTICCTLGSIPVAYVFANTFASLKLHGIMAAKDVTDLFMVVLACHLALLIVCAVIDFRYMRLKRIQNWLVDSMNWNIERLKANGLGGLPQNDSNSDDTKKPLHWPWGAHHTEYLGHLEAAARKWWVLYDPNDSTTAPTNEIVSDWLQSERNLSREKAKAIASMLRPDGLPTGPRK